MKKLILTILFGALLITASSQKIYFIYIQTESEQPFYVSMDKMMHSSSGSGYLILSKLVDSTYNFSIGFPQNKWPEQKFSVAINKKDHGFLLKQFGEKGWGLFNLQTMNVQMAANSQAVISKPVNENSNVSQFTEILSRVADDPSLKDKPSKPAIVDKKVQIEEGKTDAKAEPEMAQNRKIEKSPEIIEKLSSEKSIAADNRVKPVVIIEKTKAENTEPVTKKKVIEETKPGEAVEKKEEKVIPAGNNDKPTGDNAILADNSVKSNAANAGSVVEKKVVEVEKPIEVAEKKIVGEETPAVEINEQTFAKDPVVGKGPSAESYSPSLVKKWSESSTTEGFGLVFIDDYSNGIQDTIRLLIPNPTQIEVPVQAKSEPKEKKKFIEMDSGGEKKKEESSLTEVKPVFSDVSGENQKDSNNCMEVAGEADFLLLRKRMAAKETEEEMINEAKKYFLAKCFTSGQIKNLGALFLIDESRYNFFVVAYHNVTDEEKYAVLQNELKDPIYINRFRAMLRN